MWIVAYTVKDRENDLNEDHFLTRATEEEARQTYALLLHADDLVCACVAPIADATEPHWIETDPDLAPLDVNDTDD